MFQSCGSLKELNLSILFNTINLENIGAMFYDCPKLEKIITNQNTADWIKENFPQYTDITIVK